MIKLLIVYIFLTSFIQAAELRLEISQPVIKQGGLVNAIAVLAGESVQQVNLQGLKGSSLDDTIYIHQVSPLVRKPNNSFESDVKIIFLKVPETQLIEHKHGDQKITVSWTKVEIRPTEKVKDLIFGNFEIPARYKVIPWLVGIVVIIFVSFMFLKIRKKIKSKKAKEQSRKTLKNKIVSASDYSEVVKVWQQKDVLLKEFPELELPFKQLESVLFRYQFKPSQNESEKSEVMEAYREFVTQSARGLNGV